GGGSTFVPAIAGTVDGHTVFSTVTLGSGYTSSYTTRVLDGSWEPLATFETPWPTGALAGLTALKDGSVVGLALVGDQDSGLSLATSRWTPTSGTFSTPQAIPGTVNDPGAGNSLGLDESGDALVAWKSPETGLRMVSFGDATAPKIDSVQAPATATVNESVAFAASASDDWSDIEAIDWNFGDGTSAEGDDVSHKFTAAGTRA
ncbi:MAG TPA: PKD domain-containing protein, partial [Baekduia sp.]|nr:PKD domain-containing protein [Baekduia sp.]